MLFLTYDLAMGVLDEFVHPAVSITSLTEVVSWEPQGVNALPSLKSALHLATLYRNLCLQVNVKCCVSVI